MVTVLNRLQYCLKNNIFVKVCVGGSMFGGTILRIIDDELLVLDNYGEHIVIPIHKIYAVLNKHVKED